MFIQLFSSGSCLALSALQLFQLSAPSERASRANRPPEKITGKELGAELKKVSSQLFEGWKSWEEVRKSSRPLWFFFSIFRFGAIFLGLTGFRKKSPAALIPDFWKKMKKWPKSWKMLTSWIAELLRQWIVDSPVYTHHFCSLQIALPKSLK